MAKTYYVYILFNKNRRLYIGVTSDLAKRLYDHKHHLVNGFTKDYNIEQLAYCETGHDALGAIKREKVLKGWRREKKVALIERTNPKWRDLAEEWTGS
jgi:putative endonuclease